jgi:3-phosphoshikimate 1-carboxyvinyltransferase
MPNMIVCKKAAVGGTIDAPVSKSSQQRAIACAMVSDGVSTLYAPGEGENLCADSRAALDLAASLGAEISVQENRIQIKGSKRYIFARNRSDTEENKNAGLSVSCGESGLCMRMFSPIIALLDLPVTLNAKGSLCRRPMGMVEATLQSFGVACESAKGFAPLKIRGPLDGGAFIIDASESSQLLTGLLMALPCANKDSIIIVKNPVSLGYIDLTIDTCRAFGVAIKRNQSFTEFVIEGRQRYLPVDFSVEGDWSGAAFLVVAAAIGGSGSKLTIQGLSTHSSQPDKAIVKAAREAGARIDTGKDFISVQGADSLSSFDFDAANCPDLFPPAAILAAACRGTSIIRGTRRLAAKESDRALSIAALLRSIGIKVSLADDSMIVEGGRIEGGSVESCGDHRIAMAAAIAATIADNPIVIHDPDCVSKSWPGFYDALHSILNQRYSS